MRCRVFGTNEQLYGNCSERPEVDIPAGSGTQVPGSHPGIQCRVDQRDHARSSNADRVQSLGVDVEETVCKLRAAGESEQQEPLVRRAKAHSDILDHVQQDLVVGGVARTQELVAIRVRAINADWCEERGEYDAVHFICKRCEALGNGFDGYGANERDPVPEASVSNEWFYFVNRILALAPAKVDALIVDDRSALDIPDAGFSTQF